MNDLQVFTHDNVDVVDSRAVAEMVGKNHRDLMRSIHGYIDVMEKSTERNFAPSDFFIPRTYKDSTGRTLLSSMSLGAHCLATSLPRKAATWWPTR